MKSTWVSVMNARARGNMVDMHAIKRDRLEGESTRFHFHNSSTESEWECKSENELSTKTPTL
jgi:hypothetical protein